MLLFLGFSTHLQRLPPAHQYLGRSWISYGLNLALARKGVIVKEKVFKNLTTSDLKSKRCNYSSLSVLDAVGFGIKINNGVIVADSNQSSLILCGRAFCDAIGIKKALSALAEPIIIARGGLLLHARILLSCDSAFLIIVSEDTIRGCSEQLVADTGGVIMSPRGVSTLFRTANLGSPFSSKFPSAVVLASSDSSGVIPTISKLSPRQAAYHFLAGYQNGNFNPAYGMTSYIYDPLQIAKALFSKLVDNQIPSFLINVNEGEKHVAGKGKISSKSTH